MHTKNKEKPIIIAHAGAKGFAPENTLLAMEKAIEYAADMIEIDIRYHENKLWVFHDRRLERLCNKAGRLQDYSSQALQAITFKNQQKIPQLAEIIECINQRLPLNIEIKSEAGLPQIIQTLQHYLKKGWQSKNFLISSFNHQHLLQINQALPEIKVAALSASIPLNYSDFCTPLKNCYAVNQSISYINQKFVDHAHQNGLKVFVFTVNYQNDLDDLLKLGIDGYFTDTLFPKAPKLVAKSKKS